MFLSVDFEDFSHDLRRNLGLWKTGPLNSDALWRSYNRINNFINKNNQVKNKSITFFCTAVIAEKEPKLIRQMALDGHEVACHYFFHDNMVNQSTTEVRKMLELSKDTLKSASGQNIVGFRAPNFNINKTSREQYQIVEELFEYDSSFYCSDTTDLEAFKSKMRLSTLKIFPIFSKKIFGVNLRLGGSFLKIFPETYIKTMAQLAVKNGIEPHIYMHPYEFGNAESSRIKKVELSALGFNKSLYWALRQYQWLSLGNESVERKLSSLISAYQLNGPLKEHLL